MDQEQSRDNYTLREELANVITHGIGLTLSAAGLYYMIIRSLIYGNFWHILSFTIFGFTLVLLYASSALYHSLSNVQAKKILRKIDHSAIYLLIAGTYTPFLLTNLRGNVGWIMFMVVWGFAIIGIILKLATEIKSKWISASIYLIMGWLAVFIYKSMIENLPQTSIIFIILGGLFYTLGVIFYVWKKLPYHHAIWHLFVMAGSTFHYFSVYFILDG